MGKRSVYVCQFHRVGVCVPCAAESENVFAAHNNDLFTTNIYKDDQVRTIRKSVDQLWQATWENMVEISNKGRHLKSIKSRLSNWPWACHGGRAVETALARLRIGHVNCKAHEFRFNMALSSNCVCGSSETICHIMLQCPNYSRERNELARKLASMDVTLNLTNLLGGGDFDCSIQMAIVKHVGVYLRKIGKLYRL